MEATTLEAHLEPCGFMKRWINGLLDDSLRGLVRMYARYHISRCSRCQAALEAMRALKARLRGLASGVGAQPVEIEPARAAALKQRLDALEGGTPEDGLPAR